MTDVLWLTAGVAFFILSLGLVTALEWLRGKGS